MRKELQHYKDLVRRMLEERMRLKRRPRPEARPRPRPRSRPKRSVPSLHVADESPVRLDLLDAAELEQIRPLLCEPAPSEMDLLGGADE
jgi:hypothetical protein